MNKIIEVLGIILIVIALIGIIFISVQMKTQGAECIKNPIRYYENITNITCNCMKFSNNEFSILK